MMSCFQFQRIFNGLSQLPGSDDKAIVISLKKNPTVWG